MYAIIDKRTPTEVKKNLEKHTDDIFEFSSEGITYNSISGHPDIFLFQDVDKLIIAPNTPSDLINFLDTKKINYSFGLKPVGKSLDDSVLYNCLVTNDYFFCKHGKSDILIQESCSEKTLINIPQSFARCSMFNIENNIITSDRGIVKVLEKNNIDYCYTNPSQIAIKEYKNGFIGGTMGLSNNKVFFLGNLLKHSDGMALHKFITDLKKEVVCLGSDYLYDGGGIFFVS